VGDGPSKKSRVANSMVMVHLYIYTTGRRYCPSLRPCALLELHWLPVHYRVQFKLGLLMYMAHNGQSPMYISDALTPVSRVPFRGQLRSALTQQTTWCQGHVLSSGREHSVFPGLWSETLFLSHCELSIPSQLFVAG